MDLITTDSLDSITTHLNSCLEKLDVSFTRIDAVALLQLRTVETLTVLNCLYFGSYEFESELIFEEELKNLRKNLPQVSINEEEFYIATTKSQNDRYYENGFWEIKAKAQNWIQN